jgi:hypothetical protein
MVGRNGEVEATDLRHVVGRLADSWLRGDFHALAAETAEDVVAIGPGPADVFIGRGALLSGSRGEAPAGGRSEVGELSVHAATSAGGRSGWGWALGAVPRNDGPADRFRLSVAATREQDGWRAVHLHASFGLPNEQLEDYRRDVPPLAPVGDHVSEDATGLPDLVRSNMGAGRLSLIADRPDVVVIGTDPNEIYEGASAYREAFEPMLPQIEQLEQTMRCSFPGGLSAQLTPDGETGFVVGNVLASFGGESLPVFRLGWVFTRVDDAFRLVCDHHSAADLHRRK